MGSRHTHHHTHHPPPPPGPSLQERVANAQNKIDGENRNHDRVLADFQRQQAAIQREQTDVQNQYQQSLLELAQFSNTQESQRRARMATVESQILSQVADLEQQIVELERLETQSKADMFCYESQVTLANQKCNGYLARKQEEEAEIRKELEERIDSYVSLSQSMETSLDSLLASKAITQEAVRRFAEISEMLIRIPRQSVTDSIIASQISQYLVHYLDSLAPHIEGLVEELRWADVDRTKTLEWFKKYHINNPILLGVVENQGVTLYDLPDIVHDNAIPELDLVGWQLKKVLQLISEKDPKNTSIDRCREHIEDLSGEIKVVLTWKNAIDEANSCFLESTQKAIK